MFGIDVLGWKGDLICSIMFVCAKKAYGTIKSKKKASGWIYYIKSMSINY